MNVLSSFISFAIALCAAKTHNVGIITPYHAQSRLFHNMVRDASEITSELQPIACATVHQFQGSEKDVIVYDAVDCYRLAYPGSLLTSAENDNANRLFNVALTRARGKFICVANINYMEKKKLSKSLMFEHMIETQKGRKSCINGQKLFFEHNMLSDIMAFFDVNDGYCRFLKDITESNAEIRIDIPDKPAADEFSAEFIARLQAAKDRGVKVFVRAENKQELPPKLRSIANENPFVANPIVIIDKKITWYGMPYSDANFKAAGHVIPTQYRPIIRFVGKYTASTICIFMDMNSR